MKIPGNMIRTTVVLIVFLVAISASYVVCQRLLSLPFRETNDLLHRHDAPVTLDLCIPAGVYIGPDMPIKDVLRLRFRTPSNRIEAVLEKISAVIPVKYRILTTGLLYLFWTTVSLAFFRIVTWMRYATALAAAFLAGALLYYFMPDLQTGRIDDWIFTLWALFFAIILRWRRKREKS